jgi:nucleoside-diphosphate-sugar epimerase
MKKILVTGSSGYLGSILCGYLQERGYDVSGYDTGFFRESILYSPAQTKITFKDVRFLEEKDIEGYDVLVNLAGISNDPFGNLNSEKIYDPTREYSFALAKWCKKLGVRFVFSSSCSVYGIGQGDLMTEESPTTPQTGYSLNKKQIEEDLKSISDVNFSPIALRFATAFGISPRMRFDIVVNMLTGMAFSTKKIVLNSDGTSWRPNVHIQDICKSILFAIESSYNDGKLLTLNVGDEANNLRIIDIAQLIQKQISGCEIQFLAKNPELDKSGLIQDRKVQDGVDTRTYKVSFEKIKNKFPDFQCDWSIEKGVQDMIEQFEKYELDEVKFNSPAFYRLQTIEKLHQENKISDDLYWNK